ncbi:MAG: substrate-binding domain-containing protein [Lachnospiraceae bacterium]|nr:substrate-binding domain-containing protein [Lachnospiraceae bacterium]
MTFVATDIAFFCNCDLVASMLIRKLQNEGYRVPEDISVVGYDNYLYPGLCNVNITTYEVDIKEMARKAVDNLIDKIKGIKGRESVSIIEGHLVEKDSVKNLVL